LTGPGARQIELDWRGLWTGLRDTGVKLRTLRVLGTENAMNQLWTYLLSYTGLQRLYMRDILMDGQKSEDSAGEEFWREIVPHHKETLTSLEAYSTVDSAWCYGPRVSAALRQCLSLRALALSFRHSSSSLKHEVQVRLPGNIIS
jgi:hypothetical protein